MATSTFASQSPLKQTTPLVLEPVRFSPWPRYVLTPGRHLIGSGVSAQLCCQVSGLAPGHATIEVQSDGLLVTAHDPRTWINDGPVRSARLREGDRLTIGPCTWTLRTATTDDLLKDWPQTRPTTPPPIPTAETATTPAISSSAGTPIELITTAQALLDQMAAEDAGPTPSASATALVGVPTSQAGAPEPTIPELLRLTDELRELRRELDSARTAWRTETQRRELTLAAEAAQLDRRGAAIERTEHEQARLHQDLLQQQTRYQARLAEAQQREEALRQFEQQLAAEQSRLETLAQSTREELAAEATRRNTEWTEWEDSQRQQLSELTRRVSVVTAREQSLTTELERLTQIQRELDEAGQQLAEARTLFATEQANWTTAQQAQAQELQSQQQTLQAALLQSQTSRDATEAALQKLAADRQQLADQQSAWELERAQQQAELTRQAAELATTREELTQERQSLAEAQAQAESIRCELAQAQASLTQAQTDWAGQREQWLAEQQSVQTRREQDSAEITALRVQLDSDREQLTRDQQRLAEARSALEQAQADWNSEHTARTQQAEHDAAQRDAERHAAQATLAAHQAQLVQDRADHERAQAALAAKQAAWSQQRETESANWQAEQQSQHAQLVTEREQLAAERVSLEQARSVWASEQATFAQTSVAESAHRDAELHNSRAALAAAEQTWESERAHLQAEIAQYQQQLSARDAEQRALSQQQQLSASREATLRAEFQAELQAGREQLQLDRRLFNEQQTAWQNERDALWEDVSTRRRRLDQELADLEAARREVTAQREQLQQQAAAIPSSATTKLADPSTTSEPTTVPLSPEIAEGAAAALIQPATPPEESQLADEIASEADSTDDFAAVQEALEALAARFEVFGELEQRLEQKHVELREFQQNLADREAEFERRLSMWEQESTTQTEELRADCRRWLDHLRQLQLLIVEDWESPTPSTSEVLPEPVTLPLVEEFTSAPVDIDLMDIDPAETAPAEERGDFSADDILSLIAGNRNSSQPTQAEPAESPDSTFQPEPPAAGPAIDLRSELARMFNLPENFAPSETAAEDARSEERVDLEPLETTETESAATDAGDDNWRSRLNSLIGTYAKPYAVEEAPSRPAAEAEPVDPAAPAEVAPVEDDSIASYMERLLARTRKSSAEDSPAEVSAPRFAEQPPSPQEESISQPVREELSEPRKPVDKAATRAALQSFRQVANMSARTALAKHTWRTTRTELTIQSTLVGLCMIGMAGYLGGPLWGSQIQLGPAVACGVGAAFVGYRALQTFSRLRQWTQLIEANPLEYSASDPYIDDQIERLSHEATDSSPEVPTTPE